jgi:pyrroloquinoline quinone biosynthesis protein E
MRVSWLAGRLADTLVFVSPPPLALLAELTHRCPLRCVYCSNPEALAARELELDATTWRRVFREAAALGVLQLHLSGGEPLLYEDLDSLVSEARGLDLYTNLITSGWGLDLARAKRLADAGLDHVQVSFQDTDRERARAIAGTDALEAKVAAARAVRDVGLALSLNVVMHRGNLVRIGELIDLAASLGAARIEVASTQYHGWALRNRASLLPSPVALEDASQVARERRSRYEGRMDVIYVMPDYVTGVPKPCMDGWGQRSLTVAPDGKVLPCPGATCITTLAFDSVRHASLGDVWRESRAFQAFRGEAWMHEPCASCERRAIDFGGCRCQAFALTGDPTRTDPACSKAPDHAIILRAREQAETGARALPVYREMKR